MDRTALLRLTYRANTAASAACGLALLGAGHLLAAPLAVPAPALQGVGAFFVAFAACIWSLSRRPVLLRREAAVVGLLDGAYALASFAALAALRADMTLELRVAVAIVAVPVAIFAAVELSFAARRDEVAVA